jgi:hypothetical protein
MLLRLVSNGLRRSQGERPNEAATKAPALVVKGPHRGPAAAPGQRGAIRYHAEPGEAGWRPLDVHSQNTLAASLLFQNGTEGMPPGEGTLLTCPVEKGVRVAGEQKVRLSGNRCTENLSRVVSV